VQIDNQKRRPTLHAPDSRYALSKRPSGHRISSGRPTDSPRPARAGDARRWAAGKEIETVEIPDNLQGLLLARIDRLAEDVKRTLRVASVIGRQFSVRVLEEVLAR